MPSRAGVQPGTPRFSSRDLRVPLPAEDTGMIGKVEIPSTSDATSAPRPIGVDPASTGSFSRLSMGEGAVLTTRDNAEEAHDAASEALSAYLSAGAGSKRLSRRNRPKVASRTLPTKTNRKLFIGLGVAAFIVVLIVGFLTFRAISSTNKVDPETGKVEQTQVAANQSIEYNGYTYSAKKGDGGGYVVVASGENSSEAQTVLELKGTPVQLVLYNGTIIVPENLDGSWDVLAYTIGASGEGAGSAVMDMETGKPIGGKGKITSVVLEGSTLNMTCEDGSNVSVPL